MARWHPDHTKNRSVSASRGFAAFGFRGRALPLMMALHDAFPRQLLLRHYPVANPAPRCLSTEISLGFKGI